MSTAMTLDIPLTAVAIISSFLVSPDTSSVGPLLSTQLPLAVPGG